MAKVIWYVLWPSMMVAAIGEAVFFSLIDPKELYLLGEPVHFSPLATYSIGFIGFWLVCAASSLLTSFMLRGRAEINRKVGAGGTAAS